MVFEGQWTDRVGHQPGISPMDRHDGAEASAALTLTLFAEGPPGGMSQEEWGPRKNGVLEQLQLVGGFRNSYLV